MILADLHVHTRHSDGAMSAPALAAHVARRTTLGVYAITDHDDVAGAVEAWIRWRDAPPGTARVVVGSEVTARWGMHLLALFPRPPFPREALPRFRSLPETVARIRDLGGLVVVPHPGTALVPSLGHSEVRRLADSGHGVDAIETCTGAIGGRRREASMRALAQEVGAAEIGSSDAHHLAHVGKAVTAIRISGEGRHEARAGAWPRIPATVSDYRAGAGSIVTDDVLVRAILSRETRARWGTSGRVGLLGFLEQAGRAWAVKPAKDLSRVAQTILARRSRLRAANAGGAAVRPPS